MSYKPRKLIVTIPGVEGFRVVFEQDAQGDVHYVVDAPSSPLMAQYIAERVLIVALGFPVEPEPVETVKVEGVD